MVMIRKMSAVVISGVKLKLAAFKICACLNVSTTPRIETSAVSFCNPMKSLRSGGSHATHGLWDHHVSQRLDAREAECSRSTLL